MSPGPQSLYSDGLSPPPHHDLSVITHTLSTPFKNSNKLLAFNKLYMTAAEIPIKVVEILQCLSPLRGH